MNTTKFTHHGVPQGALGTSETLVKAGCFDGICAAA
jgi:hypothetical protein